MYDLAPPFAAGSDALLRVIQEIRDNNDSSLVPVLVEIMRFLPTRALLEGVGETLRTLSGQSLEDLAVGQVDGVARPEPRGLPAASRVRSLEGRNVRQSAPSFRNVPQASERVLENST